MEMSNEQIALELLKLALSVPPTNLQGRIKFKDYEEFLEQYKRALRAVNAPHKKGTEIGEA